MGLKVKWYVKLLEKNAKELKLKLYRNASANRKK